MKNVRVIYHEGDPNDPMAVAPTVGVRAKVEGEEYGVYVELENQDAASVCQAVETLLAVLAETEENLKNNIKGEQNKCLTK